MYLLYNWLDTSILFDPSKIQVEKNPYDNSWLHTDYIKLCIQFGWKISLLSK